MPGLKAKAALSVIAEAKYGGFVPDVVFLLQAFVV
jgi:hypothetical protein